MNNRITEIKNTLEGANNRVIEAEECISELEDRMMKITEAEHTHKKKKLKSIDDSLRDLWATLSVPIFES